MLSYTYPTLSSTSPLSLHEPHSAIHSPSSQPNSSPTFTNTFSPQQKFLPLSCPTPPQKISSFPACPLLKKQKNYNTLYSHVVPHHSTDKAITGLTAEIRRDPVLFRLYGRSSRILGMPGLSRTQSKLFLLFYSVLLYLSSVQTSAGN